METETPHQMAPHPRGLGALLFFLHPPENERHIARRYLYRARRRSTFSFVSVLTALLALLAVGAELAYFLYPAHQTPVTGALAIAAPLAFLAVFLLNLFSVFSTVAVIGVVLGVAALTVVMAVTSGFQAEIKDRVIGVNAHILVLKYGVDFREYPEVIKQTQAHPQVIAAAPFVFNEMLIAREGGTSSGVLVKGIDVKLAPRVIDLDKRMGAGPGGVKPTVAILQAEAAPKDGGPPLPGMFIGRELAHKLKVVYGDRVRLIAPLLSLDGLMPEAQQDEERAALPPRSQEFRVAGIFSAGFDEYDRRLVYVTLPQAQALVGQGDTVTGVELRARDADRARQVAREVEAKLGGAPYRTLDWEELNHNLFTALTLQKAVLGLVLFLIVLVAAFNIIASLTMMVVDKTREVAILKAMGMSSESVGAVFRVAGMTIGLYGTGMGILMGLLVCAVVSKLGYLLDAKVYLIDRLPIQVSWFEVGITGLVTLFICWLATLYPVWRAARLPPVDGLRME